MADDESNDDDDSEEVTETTDFDLPESLDFENDPDLREDDGRDTADDE